MQCGCPIVLFSLGSKAFSFGSPNVESIVDRFLSHNGHGQPIEDGNETGPVVAYQELDLDHLEELRRAMVELKKNVAQRVDELLYKPWRKKLRSLENLLQLFQLQRPPKTPQMGKNSFVASQLVSRFFYLSVCSLFFPGKIIGVTFQENGAEGKIDGEDEEGDAIEQTQVGEQAQNDAEGEGGEIGRQET
ncbi:hypothetical protein Acr_00g0045960 [Actinidia rufa]|uniref:MADS-box domain-containing protein n=1 Tax=Actinidia rufa TaxID=165716 RepID=A0A7J0DJE5_9ERIC|nr:hypothetical protein Acr_00g0045960 [Actinidia rufa]